MSRSPKKPPAPRRCRCPRDPDGRCLACERVILRAVKWIGQIQVEAAARIENARDEMGDVCGPCGRESLDRALAQSYRHLAPAMRDEELANLMLGVYFGMAVQGGATAIPLLLKAYRDHCHAHRWTPKDDGGLFL